MMAVDKTSLFQLRGSTAKGYAFDRRYSPDDSSDKIYDECVANLVEGCFKVRFPPPSCGDGSRLDRLSNYTHCLVRHCPYAVAVAVMFPLRLSYPMCRLYGLTDLISAYCILSVARATMQRCWHMARLAAAKRTPWLAASAFWACRRKVSPSA